MSNHLAGGSPERIWADKCMSPFDHSQGILSGTLRLEPDEIAATLPYILATPEALAKAPEVAALIREAEARGMERMKPVLIAYEELFATVQGECSSLLDPCRGGSDVLANLIIQANTIIQERNND